MEVDEMSWRDRAACLDSQVEFFPDGEPGSAVYERDVAAAKAVCRTCPVVRECLAEAVASEAAYGVFGGTTFAERRPLMRPRTRKVGSSRTALPR